MSLKAWCDNRWLTEHESSPQEVANLLTVIDRDLEDAKIDRLSADWRLGISYNAALQLAILALAASGYRAERPRAHERAIQSLALTVGIDRAVLDTLDAVRRKRNQSNYEIAGTASHSEAEEVSALSSDLRVKVMDWLQREHPELLGG